MSPKYPDFWRFTWHEIGCIDLPLTIDYILKETGQSSLHYVGHSQGTTVMFVLLSTRTEYSKKMRTLHMLAPVAYMKHARFPMLKITAPIYGRFAPLGPLLADAAHLYLPTILHTLGFDSCRSPLANTEYCTSLLFFTIYAGYSAYFNRTLTSEIFKIYPTRGSAHQPVHYAQLHVSGRFRQYDLGVEGNRQRYGRTTPPNYKMSNINLRFPFHFYYSDYDELSSKVDVEHLSRILGNRSVQHFIDLKHFSHLDFIFATNVKNVINRQILETMNEAELLLNQNNSKYL